MEPIQTKSAPASCRWRRWDRKAWAAFASLRRAVTIGVLSVGMSILLLASEGALAQTADTVAVVRNLRIDEVGITGSQSAPTRTSLALAPLFDRKAQAAAPLQTLEGALRLQPAVDLRERGGKGTQADITLRGGSFDQTMVLLNGIDFTDARTGHQSHSLPVDLDCIAGVDLVDGIPGLGAYAGAVNIRTAPLRPRYLRLAGEGGQHGYAYANLSGALSGERSSLMAAGSYHRSDGYRSNTDFDTYNAYLRATHETRRAGLFDFQAGWQRRAFGSNGFYAAYNPDQWERTSTALASLRWVLRRDSWSAGASASYRKNRDRYDWTRGKATNRHATGNVGARAWAERRWAAGTTTLGGDYAFNRIYSTNLGTPLASPRGDYLCADARHTGNLYLSHAARWRRFDLSGSAGASFSPYGGAALWTFAAGWRPSEGLRLETGASQSMRLPTFTDLYYSSPAQINNLDLRPERAVTWRLGADWRQGRWHASALTYYRAGREVIDWVWHGDDDPVAEWRGKWHSEQTSELDTWGLELAAGYARGEGVLRRVVFSYAHLTVDRSREVVVSSAMDFLRDKAALEVGIRFLRRLSLTVVSSVYNRNGSYTDYPVPGDASVKRLRAFRPYMLFDARLAWERGILRLHLDATNLADASYCDLGGIPLPGRWITAGVTVTVGP